MIDEETEHVRDIILITGQASHRADTISEPVDGKSPTTLPHVWCSQGLNPRPTAYEAKALPLNHSCVVSHVTDTPSER